MPSDPAGSSASVSASNPLPRVVTALTPDRVIQALDAQSKDGKLAGFRRVNSPTDLCAVAAFAEPFDREILISARPSSSGCELAFRMRLLPRVPLIFALVIAFSIWPGVWLTDSMLTTYFEWYTIETWWWYLPLTIVPLLWMIPRMWKKSSLEAAASAREVIAKVALATQGRIADTEPVPGA
ncbi:MAG: hypothetical protein SFZ23_11940 [Planctomycetota bacterium]|nr:hypothetical protein [Planctomycetota bacterium]